MRIIFRTLHFKIKSIQLVNTSVDYFINMYSTVDVADIATSAAESRGSFPGSIPFLQPQLLVELLNKLLSLLVHVAVLVIIP